MPEYKSTQCGAKVFVVHLDLVSVINLPAQHNWHYVIKSS